MGVPVTSWLADYHPRDAEACHANDQGGQR
jgi:hypothetical protein